MTDDAKPRKRRVRIVHSPPRGSQRNLRHGAKARHPVGDLAKAREDARAWIMELAPIRDTDGGVPKEYLPAIEVMALPLSRLRHMNEYLEEHPNARGNLLLAKEMRRLERHVWAMLGSFGMTPKDKANLGLTLSATDALQHIKPVRTVERAQEVARLIAQNGMAATPSPPDADTDVIEGHEVEEPEPEPEPKVRRMK